MFCDRIPAPLVPGVRTKTRLESRFCNKEVYTPFNVLAFSGPGGESAAEVTVPDAPVTVLGPDGTAVVTSRPFVNIVPNTT